MYEGVGWHVQGLHTQGYNNVSLGIAFFGSKIGKANFLQTQKVASLLPLLSFANAYIFVTYTVFVIPDNHWFWKSFLLLHSITCRFFLIYGLYLWICC